MELRVSEQARLFSDKDDGASDFVTALDHFV
jgi:hypothetical protein